MTLGSTNISERALAIDERAGWLITLIGIPSAFLLHGYVGFIFGSVKANPWWSTPLMPVVFLFSAMVSGIALVMLLYMLMMWARRQTIDMRCVDTVARYLFYTFIIDFSLEMLDLIHRIYEADESFRSLDFMVHTKLYVSHIVVQIALGTITPIVLLALTQVLKLSEMARKRIYVTRRMPDPDRHLRHALECRDRRTAILEELSRIHDLQDGPSHEGGIADGNGADRSAIRDPVGTGETSATLAGEKLGFTSRHHTCALSSNRVRGQPVAFVTAKLLFEDLPHGHSGSIAISIFLYAGALLIVSRLARSSPHQKASGQLRD